MVTLGKFAIKITLSAGRFLFLVATGRHGRLIDIRTVISSESIQLLQRYIATYGKKLEEMVFVEEVFLYKKIGKKDVYVDCGATADIPQVVVKQYGDLAALK